MVWLWFWYVDGLWLGMVMLDWLWLIVGLWLVIAVIFWLWLWHIDWLWFSMSVDWFRLWIVVRCWLVVVYWFLNILISVLVHWFVSMLVASISIVVQVINARVSEVLEAVFKSVTDCGE